MVLVWWAYVKVMFGTRTPEDYLREIVDEMEGDPEGVPQLETKSADDSFELSQRRLQQSLQEIRRGINKRRKK